MRTRTGRGMGVNILAVVPPILDRGWRVGLYPPGTTLASAVMSAIIAQQTQGLTLDSTAPPRILPSYWVRGTADVLPDDVKTYKDDGWRDVVAQLGTVAVLYRVSGPGVHNP